MGLPPRRFGAAALTGLAVALCGLAVTVEAGAATPTILPAADGAGEQTTTLRALRAAGAQRVDPQATRAAATLGWTSDGLQTGPAGLFTLPGGPSGFAAQHGPVSEHLPAAKENVELISKLELKTPDAFKFDPVTRQPDPTEPDIVPGQIADVSTYKNAAYLASWAEPSCKRGGFFSVDVSDPANPEQLAFVPALPGTYHGEGTHTITLNTPEFQGDLLAVNNEACDAAVGTGGFDLYDVSNPAAPVTLIQGAGDKSPDHADGNPFAPLNPVRAKSNSSHSIYIWQDGPNAYAVIVDNTEFSDTDIFDITDPRNPEFIADVDLLELAFSQDVPISLDSLGNGVSIFLHDMVVKEIGGVPTLLASYWDLGYLKVDLSDPANPVYVGRSDFSGEDPVMNVPGTDEGWTPPEGNAHQGEFSHDNRFVLTADEDFAQFRFRGRIALDPSGVFEFGAAGQPDEGPLVSPGNPLAGNTRFVGEACTAGPPIPPPGAGVTIAVAERGTCAFQEKVANAAAAGYKDVVIFNTPGAPGPPPTANPCETTLGMDFTGYAGTARSIFVPRFIGLILLGVFDEDTYSCVPLNPGASTPSPAVGTAGRPIDVSVLFDGWGYMHLYDNSGNDLEAIDHFAIEEARDERYAFGFGDLTVHEFATDPTENLAYSSYYAGGLRVMSFGRGRHRAGRQVHRRRRQQLLGCRGLRRSGQGTLHRGLGPRLRALPVPLYRRAAGAGADAAGVRCDQPGDIRRPGDDHAALHRHQRQPADVLDRQPAEQRHPERARGGRHGDVHPERRVPGHRHVHVPGQRRRARVARRDGVDHRQGADGHHATAAAGDAYAAREPGHAGLGPACRGVRQRRARHRRA